MKNLSICLILVWSFFQNTCAQQCGCSLYPPCTNPIYPICLNCACVECNFVTGQNQGSCAQNPTTTRPLCSVSSCAPCTSHFSCGSVYPNRPLCFPDGSCNPCSTDPECLQEYPSTPYCSSSGACIPCSLDSWCQNQFPNKPICSSNGTCVPCSSSPECQAHYPSLPICRTNGSCTICTSHSECFNDFSTEPFCSSNDICVPCSNNTECRSEYPFYPLCQTNGTCNPCYSHSECQTSFPLTFPYCLNHECVNCVNTSNCQNSSFYCNYTYNCERCQYPIQGCERCYFTENCTNPFMPYCLDHLCQPCTDDTHCQSNPSIFLPYFSCQMVSSTAITKCFSVTTLLESSSEYIRPDVINTVILKVNSTASYDISLKIFPSEIDYKAPQHESSSIFINHLSIMQFDSLSKQLDNQSLVIAANVTNAFHDNNFITLTLKVEPLSRSMELLCKITSGLVRTAVVTSGILAAFGMTVGLINLMRLLLYLFFFNVLYSYELNAFLIAISTSRFDFLPNLFIDWNLVTFQKDSIPTPQKFYDHDFDGMILLTCGSPLFYIIIIWTLGLLANLSNRILRKNHKIKAVLHTLEENRTLSGIARAWIVNYTELMLGSVLSLYSANFQNSIFGFSAIFGGLCFILNLVIPFLLYIKIKKKSKSTIK